MSIMNNIKCGSPYRNGGGTAPCIVSQNREWTCFITIDHQETEIKTTSNIVKCDFLDS